MNVPMTPRKVAVGLLVFSLLALLVGVFNAARLAQESMKSQAAEAKSAVSSLLNKQNRLALIELTGMITMAHEEGGLFGGGDSNAVSVRKALDAAAKDDSIKGVLLHINSPGGTVGMSQELNAAVRRVTKKKPVVVSMGDLTASGGYYTACAADKILANPGTLTASIGVIISTMDFSDLMTKKLGVEAVTIKSGKFKDILSPYRKPTAEDRALVQSLVMKSYYDFLETVIQGRTRFLTDKKEIAERTAKITAVADGRVVTGREALEAGLVDEIGDLDRAHEVLDRMAKERFRIKGKDRLPLEDEESSFSLMQMMGLGAKGVANRLGAATDVNTQMARLLPLSLRYPNQPLWVME